MFCKIGLIAYVVIMINPSLSYIFIRVCAYDVEHYGVGQKLGGLGMVKANAVMQCDIAVVLEYGILLKCQRGYCMYIAYGGKDTCYEA
jgi:hypothetical protein